MINVTKTYLPPFEEYTKILKRAWDKAWITNNGDLVQELEGKLKDYLKVDNLSFTNNGTIVLQMALKALNITKGVITTPFSYVATTNAILWEGCKPIFVDIDPETLCIDVNKIESAITSETEAILATHVYGFPCDVETIDIIAKKHGLKVIYDGAHAFGVSYKGRSLLSYGDISTCSFHATKIFHTVEGGCIICNDDDVLARKVLLYRQFGHIGEDHFSMGINGKNSEFHAAMGLSILPKLAGIIAARKEVFEVYDKYLSTQLIKPNYKTTHLVYNYSYYPIICDTANNSTKIKDALFQNEIAVRRYFSPSLNTMNYLAEYVPCPISEDISSRILCLPLYPDLEKNEIEKIINIINATIN